MKIILKFLIARLTFVRNDRAWRLAVIAFCISRLILSVWMWGIRQIIPLPLSPDPVLRPYLGVKVEQNSWLEVWQRWDSLHYQAIAERGYSAFDTALFVPPLYPGLIRLTARFMGENTLAAGILISNIFYFACLVCLYRLVANELEDSPSAVRSVIYLAGFPTAFFFLAAYTESLFLLTVILALGKVRQEDWVQAGFWGALAPLARLPGILIIAPLSWAAWQAWRQKRDLRAWMAPGLAIIGSAIFPLYIRFYLGLPPWMPFVVQNERYHGGLVLPGKNLVAALRMVITEHSWSTNGLELAFTLILLIGIWPVWNKLPRIYGIYYLSFIAIYLSRIAENYPLLGMTRYVLALFPLFMLLGKWGQNPWVNRTILYSSWMLLLYLAGQFALWGWAG